MIVLILGAFIFAAVAVGRVATKVTGRRWVGWTIAILLLIAPFIQPVAGQYEFQKFSREHPGKASNEVLVVSGVLLTGRDLASAVDGIRVPISPPLEFYEYKSESIRSWAPPIEGSENNYVQLRLVNSDDPTCFKKLESVITKPMLPDCIGLTFSNAPISKYELFEEPNRQIRRFSQLNSSGWLPILGRHAYVREIRTGRLVAEQWQFMYSGWWSNGTEYTWLAQINPAGPEPHQLFKTSRPTLEE